MNSFRKQILAGILSAVLLFSCSGCGRSAPEVTDPILQAPEATTGNIQETAPTSPVSEETQPILPLPEETQPIPTLPLPEETQPIPTLPLPEETQPIPTLPLPEETSPTVPDEITTPSVEYNGKGILSPHLLNLRNLTAAPQYPDQPMRPDPENYLGYSSLYEAQSQWKAQAQQARGKSPENAHDLDPFLKKAMAQFLSKDGNQVFAPLNVYFALAMLAEVTDGTSRQQILTALGHSSIESLRTQANQLWKAHYYNDGETTSLMANSVWLDNQYSFQKSVLNTLSKDYFASVFTGDLGTSDMNKQLSTWLNSQTGNLLSDYAQNIALDPATVFCLASTAYFAADWDNTFSEAQTRKETFHCDGYDRTADFMHETYENYYYYVDPSYSAIYLKLSGYHKMWLILPDEGYTPEDLLKQGNYYSMICDPYYWSGSGKYTVNLSLPKFDVSSEQELNSGLQALGITDVFNPKTANFRPLTNSALHVGEVSHAARVTIDEEGVLAAAYTILQAPGAALPPKTEEVDFVLDRPFLFIITGSDNLPIFAGTVHHP